MDFNSKLQFSVWCTGFGAPELFTTGENYNTEKNVKKIWIWNW